MSELDESFITNLANTVETPYFSAAVKSHFGSLCLVKLLAQGIDVIIYNNLVNILDSFANVKIGVLENFLNLTNALLPRIPGNLNITLTNEFEQSLDGKVDEFKKKWTGSIERFLSKIISPILKIFKMHCEGDRKHLEDLHLVFLKVIHFSSTKILKRALNKEYIGWMRLYVHTRCLKLQEILIAGIVTLLDKGCFVGKILTYDVILLLRQCSQSSNMYTINISDFYEKYQLESKLEKMRPTWRPLLEACEHLKNSSIILGVRMLTSILTGITSAEVVASNLIECLRESVFESPNSEEMMDELIRGATDIIPICSLSFNVDVSYLQQIIGLLVQTVDYLHSRYITFRHDICQSPVYVTPFEYKSKLITAVTLLKWFHFLSTYWVQKNTHCAHWELVEDEVFFCSQMSDYLKSILPQENRIKNLEFYKDLAKICPVIFRFRERHWLFCLILEGICSLNSITSKTFTVNRKNIFKEFKDCFSLKENVNLRWQFRFTGEVGEGEGPTKEFYTLVSHEYQKHELGLWFGNAQNSVVDDQASYVESPNGLYPKIVKSSNSLFTELFVYLGKFFAKALLDNIRLDLDLNIEFFRRLLAIIKNNTKTEYIEIINISGEMNDFICQLHHVKDRLMEIKNDMSLTEEQRNDLIAILPFDNDYSFEDLCMNFTVPGSDEELVDGGADIMLSASKVEEYLHCFNRVIGRNLTNAALAFYSGFSEILPSGELKIFLPKDLKRLFSGEQHEKWTVAYLKSCCSYSNGYDAESPSVGYLFEVLSSLDPKQQKAFLQFTTSTTKLPFGGLKSLRPSLLIYKAGDNDGRLPYTATCTNTIFLPAYSSLEITRERLLFAMNECCSFELA